MTGDRHHSSSTLALAIEGAGWTSALADAEALASTAALAALAAACPDLGPAGLSVLLTDDARMRALNGAWRGLDQPTNVLSFPATGTRAGETPLPEFAGVPLELGDIALGFETCQREAATQGKSLDAHALHLIVHGVLHLLGYDH